MAALGGGPGRTASTPIHTGAEGVGFWQFVVDDVHHLGVLDRDLDEPRSVLTLLRIAPDASVHPVRRIENEDTSVRAADARVVGTDLLFALEINRGDAVHLVRAPLAALLDPAEPPVPFQPVRTIGLSDTALLKVQLPAGELWNVADSLAPRRWLFSPSLARGPDSPEMVINNADGRAMLFASSGDETNIAVRDAARPQLIELAGQRIAAFERFERPYRPFWSLARYSGPKRPAPGRLWVVEGSSPPRDLSAELTLGPVTGFALAPGGDSAPWLFALRGAGNVLTALTRRETTWTVVGDIELDTPAECLSALWHGQAWHFVLAAGMADAMSLRYLRRP